MRLLRCHLPNYASVWELLRLLDSIRRCINLNRWCSDFKSRWTSSVWSTDHRQHSLSFHWGWELERKNFRCRHYTNHCRRRLVIQWDLHLYHLPRWSIVDSCSYCGRDRLRTIWYRHRNQFKAELRIHWRSLLADWGSRRSFSSRLVGWFLRADHQLIGESRRCYI